MGGFSSEQAENRRFKGEKNARQNLATIMSTERLITETPGTLVKHSRTNELERKKKSNNQYQLREITQAWNIISSFEQW